MAYVVRATPANLAKLQGRIAENDQGVPQWRRDSDGGVRRLSNLEVRMWHDLDGVPHSQETLRGKWQTELKQERNRLEFELKRLADRKVMHER